MKSKDIIIENYKGITADSRDVRPGYIYVSIKGQKIDGDKFILEAINNGATLIITELCSSFNGTKDIKVVKVNNSRSQLAKLANKFYQPQPPSIVAVTGTSGKTSVAFFYKQIAELLNCKSACIGTLGVVSNSASIQLQDTLTSPDAVTLNKTLQQLAKKNVTHVSIEASSHGIKQKRIKGINFTAAAFTNFSQDHLDYHKTMEEYFEAKMELFSKILKKGYAIINADIPQYLNIINILKNKPSIKILTYGYLGDHIKFLNLQDDQISLEILGSKFTTQYNLEGDFQIHNLMAAIGLAIATQFKPYEIMQIIPKIIAAPGRLEKVAIFNGAKIFVDYAHKPDALDKSLQTLNKDCKGEVHVIFGCGGDRDKSKRPIMGEIAAKHANYVIITDDNPRTENAAAIRKDIISACPNALEYDNRARAIAETIKKLKPNDVLLIAGKGHETYQIIGNKNYHFSDTEEVMRAIKNFQF